MQVLVIAYDHQAAAQSLAVHRGRDGAHRRVAPSVREIADHFHYRSPTMARRLLIGLEERGFIRRLAAKDRAIEVLKPVSRFATFRFDPKAKSLRRRT